MSVSIYRKSTSSNSTITPTIKQLVKLNVEAGHTSTIDNTGNDNFKNIFDIYKITGSQSEVVNLLADFTNSESTNFIHSNNVSFDGDMHFQTNFTDSFQKERDLISGKEYTVLFDKSSYKSIASISNNDLNLNIQAIPQDELIIANDYISLNTIENIDKFILVGTDIKVIINNGAEWFTLDTVNNKFITINTTVEDVKIHGIDINTFNSISSLAWNDLLLTNKKVKFGYLLAMNSIDDNVKASNISMQVDINGFYTKAVPGNDFDVNLKQKNIEIVFLKNNSYIVNYL